MYMFKLDANVQMCAAREFTWSFIANRWRHTFWYFYAICVEKFVLQQTWKPAMHKSMTSQSTPRPPQPGDKSDCCWYILKELSNGRRTIQQAKSSKLVKSQCNTTHHRKCLDSGLRPENNQHTSHNDISITIDTDHDISQHSRMWLIHNPCFVKNILQI